MPQMSPLMWLNIYMYMLMLFMLILIMLYFIYLNKFMLQSLNNNQKEIIYKFKW